jgi:glycosyltransferase involved in cell wall biosynthesis
LLYPNADVDVLYCPIEFMPSALDGDRRTTLRRGLQTSAEDIVIIQSSRMEGWKGHSLHLDALSRLKDLRGWVLWIAGGAQRLEEQNYTNALKGQAESLGIAERVRFLGHRSDIPDLLAAADIHCQPNLGPEPYGIAFVEAMMAGLPIATCRLGAAPELIDKSCGLLCEPGDVGELASALRTLITDQDIRERLGRNGPARARQLSDPASRLNELFMYLSGQTRAGRAMTPDVLSH